MALNPAGLNSSFQRIAKNPGEDKNDIADRWSKAYDDYAKTAQAGALLPQFTGTEVVRLRGIILTAISAPVPVPAVFANAWATGIASYWLTPPVPFAGAGTGTPTAFPGQATLPPALISILSAPKPESISTPAAMATAIDVATRTIIVTFAPPPGSTAPLS